jgi:aryl-alcohol dehydrogenase-like predicted oxidoreductase
VGHHQHVAADQHCRPLRHLTKKDTTMQTLSRRFLPGLGTEVSAVGAGCWAIGGPAVNNGVPIGWDNVDPAAAYAGLLRAHELGVTLFDTADVYGLGRSERLLGRLLHTIDRNTVVISSKVGYFTGTARHGYHPTQIRHQLATTLDNLGTDYLDIYHLHCSDFGDGDRYLPGAIDVMAELRGQGLIRAVGMRAPHTFAEQWATSDHPQAAEAARFLHLFHTIRPDVVTARYNLLSPHYAEGVTDIFALARRHGVGVIVKQALAQGLLLKPHPDAPRVFSAADHRTRDPDFQPAALAALRQRLAPIRERFGDRPADLARVAVGYALHHAPDSPVLVGFRDADHIHTTITSLQHPLTPEEITDIRAALHPAPATRKA